MYILELLSKELKNSVVAENELMGSHTSFKTGGPADIFVNAGSYDDIASALEILSYKKIPTIIIGNGTNILVGDKGIRGAVIAIGSLMGNISVEGNKLFAQAGAILPKVASKAFENSLTGLEFASGIPASVGGAVYMNAGAYGGEIKDVLLCIYALDSSNLEFKKYNVNELDMAYRKSNIDKKGLIVMSAEFGLEKGDAFKIKEKMEQLSKQRRTKQPLNYPSAGSTFKRPEGYFAGKLIEDSGLKGFEINGACVSEKHAGFIINKGEAKSSDILDVIKHCQNKVYEKFGVKLETEVKILGEW